ncbi:MAG: hypothetical protein ACP5RX_03010, partial [Minisyncoccia bacterium]
MNYEEIPPELKGLPQWILYKKVPTGYGGTEILPIDNNGIPLKIFDLEAQRSILMPFDRGMERLSENREAGLGFLITPDLPYHLISLNLNDEKIHRVKSFTVINDNEMYVLIKLKNKNKNSEIQFLPFTNNHMFNEIKEFEDLDNFYNIFNGLTQEKPSKYSLNINPEAWYDFGENNEKKFDFTKCAEDIINSNEGLIITEYTSNMLFVW